MYARQIDGELYDFGVSGKLIMNVLVMYDRQTESYWSQLLGEAVAGPMAGTQLNFVTSWFTTWREWRERHPNTVALDKGGLRSDTYSSYYRDGRAGIVGETVDDGRLDTKEFVIGVEHEGQAVAYPFEALARQPLVNDTVGGKPVVIVFLRNSQTGMVYERIVDDRTLTFTYDSETETLHDEETGSVWDPWLGNAMRGPLQGEQLRRMDSTRSFWFGWKDWYPDTEVWRP